MCDCSAICSRIEEILDQIKVKVVFEYSSKKLNEEFRYNRGIYLIKICNKKSK